MKLKIIVIGSFALIGSFYPCSAQENIREAFFNGSEKWQVFIAKEASEARKKNDNIRHLCINSVTFAKFTVDANGSISSISFLEDTPPEITNILKAIIQSTNGMWSPRSVNGKPTESQPFLLPLYFYLNYGCQANALGEPNKFGQALQNMLKFDDGNSFDRLDCILLSPIEISSVK